MNIPSKKNKTRYLLLLAAVIVLLGLYFYTSYGNKTPLTAGSKRTLVIGHAGSGFFSPLNPVNLLPANSMGSIVKALEKNRADGVEVDIHITKDGVPVLYHDTSLESSTTGTGMIEEKAAAEVLGLAYTGGFPYELFHHEKVISLEDLLTYLQQYPEYPHLHLDLRNYTETPAHYRFYASSLLAVLKKHNYPLEKALFISPDVQLLKTIEEAAPTAVLMIDMGDDFRQTLAQVLDNDFDGLVANGKKIKKEDIAEARSHGLQVVLFGGKSRSSVVRMLGLEPDAIEVNNVKTMRALVDEQ